MQDARERFVTPGRFLLSPLRRGMRSSRAPQSRRKTDCDCFGSISFIPFMKNQLFLRFLLIVAFSIGTSRANVKLSGIFSDHMVLKRSDNVPIWGQADPDEEVTVTQNGQTSKVRADGNGRWSTTLNLSGSTSGPFEMTIEGKNKIVLNDVVIGEVWIASGQSNMDFMLKNAIDADTAIQASDNPMLRIFVVKKNAASEPREDTDGKWIVSSPQASGDFSAVGFFFAEKLQRELRVPVGLIQTSWGGTPVEAWTSAGAIATNPDLESSSERVWRAIKEYPSKKQAYVEEMRTWIKENSREDRATSDTNAFAGELASMEGWTPIKLPGLVTAPGFAQSGVVWLRKEINVPVKGDKLPLYLPIDGFDSVYWNGKLIEQVTYETFPGTGHARRGGPYNIPDSELKEGRNVLAIRLYEPIGPARFSAEPKAGSVSLSGEWLAKAQYEFPVLSASQLTSAPAPLVKALEPYYAPSYLFNGMVRPIIPYAISGVIWYQGEANANRAFQYRSAFPLMIADWRKQWNQGDFSFYFCQLANFYPKKPDAGDSVWAELREAQSMTLKLPNTGQAVLVDLGESNDIHPRDKRSVGERLASIALARDYGRAIPYSGPVFDSLKVEGNKAILTFKNTNGGLVARPLEATYVIKSKTNETAPLVRNSPASQLEGFAVCGQDRKWFWADSKIDGDTVIVTSDKVSAPVAVRYAWADNPTCNLGNGAGFPASPFRTDDFPGKTVNVKY